MANTDNHNHDSGAGHHHVTPVSTYVATYVALLVLLVLTFAVSRVDLGPFNIIVALGISVVKTAMVVLIFMGVKYGTRLTWFWASIGFIWLVLLFLTLGDYVTRQWVHLPLGW